MPGKYSHSVVLADFSSRGVIALPDEQHRRYFKAPTQQQSYSASNSRGRSKQPAQAAYRPASTPRQEWDPRTSDRPHPSLTIHTPTSRPRVNVPVDTKDAEARPKRLSQACEQVPQGKPSINVYSQAEAKTASERQHSQRHATQLEGAGSGPAQSAPASESKRASTYLSPAEALLHPAFRASQSNSSMREDAAKTRQRQQSPGITSGTTSSSETLAASSTCSITVDPPESLVKRASASNHNIPNVVKESSRTDTSSHSDGRVTPLIWRCVTTPEDETRRAKQEQILRDNALKDEKVVTPEIWKCPSTPEDETRQSKQEQILRSQMRDQRPQTGSEGAPRPSSKGSRLSRSTQIWDPQPDVLEEPDFDGFSPQLDVLEEPDFGGFTDQEEPPASYFDLPKRAIIHSRSSSHDSTLVIQRPGTQEGLKSEEQKDHAPPPAPSRASSIRTADRSTPSRATASSTVASSQGWRSNTPASSVNIPNIHVQLSENTASPRKDARASSEKHWRLPEIQEDHGFSPSIFEDREGSNELLTLQDFAAERRIGRISSGKNVTVNDAASELSAALPPPITRFRDDEDEFNSNMAKLYGEGGNYAVSKKGSHTIGRSAMKKEKRGFFAKFRSRSQPPRK